jgi:pilus assembly protein Flp/PilA
MNNRRKGGAAENKRKPEKERTEGIFTLIKNTKSHQGGLRMEKMMRFFKDEEGATAVEYGLIVVLIAIAIIVGAGLLGTNLNALFTRVAGTLGS